jgi:hypothetical protein
MFQEKYGAALEPFSKKRLYFYALRSLSSSEEKNLSLKGAGGLKM